MLMVRRRFKGTIIIMKMGKEFNGIKYENITGDLWEGEGGSVAVSLTITGNAV